MGCCEELASSCKGAGIGDCSSNKHEGSKLTYSRGDASSQYTRRSLPSYGVWRAQQLASRDLLFGTFLMLITLIYVYRTAPKLCDEAVYARLLGARCTHIQQEHECLEVCQQPDQPPGLVWRLVCRCLGDPTAATAQHEASLTQNSTCSAADECPVSSPQSAAAAAALMTKASSIRLALREVVRCSRSAVRKVFRAVVMFFIAGALSGDPFHITMPLLRLSLLLLLLVPMPYPNVAAVWQAATAGFGRQHAHSSWVGWYRPRHYWQYPNFRLLVVVVQRVVTALAAFACVGFRYSAYFESSMKIMYWQGLAKYAVQGWLAWMLVLPFRLHLVVSAVEWIFFYALGVQIERLYHGKEGLFDLYHLVTSLLSITILPSVGVWWLERSQQARYQELARLMGSDSAATTTPSAAQHHDDDDLAMAFVRPDKLDIGGSSSSSRHTSVGPHKGVEVADSHSASHSASNRHHKSSSHAPSATSQSRAASQQLYSSVVDGLQLLEAQKQQQQQQVAAPHLGDATTVAAAATLLESAVGRAWPAVPSVLASVGPALRSVLADEAAEVFAAAAACAAAAGGAAVGGIPSYTSMAKCLPAGVKVHTAHSNVCLLEPLLTSCLAAQAGQLTSAPAYMQAACFAGCVQLLANIFVARSAGSGALDSNTSDGSKGAGASAAAASSRGTVVGGGGVAASALLAAVRAALYAQGEVEDNGKEQESRESSTTAAAVTSAAAAAAALPQMVPFRTDSAHVDVDVVFGGTMASTTAHKGAGGVSGETLLDVAGVQLVSCEPACLVSGLSQQLTLHLQLHGAAEGSGACGCAAAARLVVFTDGLVLVDEEVVVEEQISVTLLAPRAAGVISIALLPCANMDTAGSFAATSSVDETQQQQPAASVPCPAVPLLLTPLLVLPAEAAHEVQQYWQQTVNAVVIDENGSSDCGSSSAWQSSVLPVTIDVAYVLAASNAAAAASAGKTAAESLKCSAEFRTVLKHLLLHLARCGMFHTMQFVVTTAAAAAAQQGPAAADSVEDIGSSSSSSCDVGVLAPSSTEIEPAAHDDGSSYKLDKACNLSHSGSMQRDTSSGAGSHRTVAASELLWGFRDPATESSYQAATFRATSMLDCACAVYNLVLSLCCYPSRGQKHQGGIGMLRLPRKPSGTVLMFSRLLALVVVAAGPVGVLLVRLRAAGQLQALAQQRQQQQRQQPQQVNSEENDNWSGKSQKASCSSGSSGSSKSIRVGAAVSSSQQQQHLYDEQVSAVLASAAGMKQWLQLYWMVAINVWGVLVLLGASFIAPPMPILRVWASSRWAADLGITTSVALRGWVSQVPLAWHLPLIMTELAANATGSWMVGVHPPHWPLVRFLTGVILPVVVATWQHWQGRRRFCATRGIQVA